MPHRSAPVRGYEKAKASGSGSPRRAAASLAQAPGDSLLARADLPDVSRKVTRTPLPLGAGACRRSRSLAARRAPQGNPELDHAVRPPHAAARGPDPDRLDP